MTMITPSYLGETIEYSSLHACRSTLEDPTFLRDDQGGLGLRVPMIVVSAYAKQGKASQGYVSHTQYEFGSILKYIETNFNLPSLGTTDARAASIGDVFNYNQSPRPFTVIPSAHDAHYFITHRERVSHGDPE